MNFLLNVCVNWQNRLMLNALHNMEVWDSISLVLLQLNLCSISSIEVQGVEEGDCEHGEVFGEGFEVSQKRR